MNPVINPERRPSKVLKFAPVKLLVIESRAEYYRTVGFAIGVGLSHVFIGATTMVTFMYTLQTKDIHAVLCTFGYQFLSGEGILSLSYINGWSAHLRLKHRKCTHIALQICGIGCVLCGMMSIMSSTKPSWTFHCSTGVTAHIFTLLSIISGPLGLHEVVNVKFLHMGFGLLTYAMSSISLCLGFYTSEFKQWADSVIIYVLTSFVTAYTLCICIATIVYGIILKTKVK